MIVDWIAQSGVLALALIVIFGPGLLVGRILRLRGLMLWAAAPGISTGSLAALAVVFPFLGISWERSAVAIAVLVIAAALWGASALITRRSRSPRFGSARGFTLLLGAGLLVGGGVNAARLLTYIGTPSAISQTNDAVFHLNALRWVAETGSASSLDLLSMIGASGFYPAAWHALASLIVTDATQIPIVANMVSVVIAAVVWPLSIAALTAVISRGDRAVTALAAALSAGLLAFPQLMFEWGVLYPYALSLAIVPASVALTINATRAWLGAGHGVARRLQAALGHALAAVVSVAGVALAQPSTLLVWGLLSLLWASALWIGRRATLPSRARTASAVLISVGWLALAGMWAVMTYLAGPVLWRSYRGVLGAIGDVVLNSHSLLPPALGMSVLLVAGLVLTIRSSPFRWVAVAWGLFSLLYVVSVGTDLPVIKRLLTGPWYGDSFRLAAMVPIVVIPLAAIGLVGLLRWLVSAANGRMSLRPRWLLFAAVGVIGIIGAVGVIVSPVVLLRVADETDEQSRYALNGRSYLSVDEYRLLTGLDEVTPADALLIGNPSTGAAFAYVLGAREVVPRTWAPPQTDAWHVISTRLRDAGSDPTVCDALASYGQPDYVLDFGRGEHGPGLYVMPGMTDFEGQPGFEEAAREGEASLWRITACD